MMNKKIEEMRKMAEGKDKRRTAMSKLQKQSVDTWVRWAAERNLSLTRAEVKEMVDKYNDIISQSVPFSGGARLKPNNTDRMTKWRTDQICFPRDLNIHDPDNKYRWQEEEAQAPAWVWAMRGLGVVGFVVGIYMLTLLTFLF